VDIPGIKRSNSTKFRPSAALAAKIICSGPLIRLPAKVCRLPRQILIFHQIAIASNLPRSPQIALKLLPIPPEPEHPDQVGSRFERFVRNQKISRLIMSGATKSGEG